MVDSQQPLPGGWEKEHGRDAVGSTVAGWCLNLFADGQDSILRPAGRTVSMNLKIHARRTARPGNRLHFRRSRYTSADSFTGSIRGTSAWMMSQAAR